jgi:hypothetical protein
MNNTHKRIEEKQIQIRQKQLQIQQVKSINAVYQQLKKQFNSLNKEVCLSFKVRPEERNVILKYCLKQGIVPSMFFRDTILEKIRNGN